MNIDERIEKLTERTEALTQSVELLSQMHQDNEKRYATQLEQLQANMHKLTSISESLARIAQNHDHRIERLEDGQ